MAKVFKIMIVAGEASGDAHSAALVESLRERFGPSATEFFGLAGSRLVAAGVESSVNADDLAIMGIPEIAAALPKFVRIYRELIRLADERKPDIVVLVDFPEFNLKLAKRLKKMGFRIVYYISPQLWGWRQYRRRTIEKYVDVLLSILPFESEWYAQRGIKNVAYVGNPLVNEIKSKVDRKSFRYEKGIDQAAPLVALLPGSRHKEIVRILPKMIQTASLIAQKLPTARFIVGLARTRFESEVSDAILTAERLGTTLASELISVKDETFELLNAADAAVVASGTATLETGVIGTPMAIVYETSNFNYRLVRPLISVEHFGLINLVAGKRLANEFVQDGFKPSEVADEVIRLIDPEVNRAVRASLNEAVRKLGAGGASERAAEIIAKLITAN